MRLKEIQNIISGNLINDGYFTELGHSSVTKRPNLLTFCDNKNFVDLILILFQSCLNSIQLTWKLKEISNWIFTHHYITIWEFADDILLIQSIWQLIWNFKYFAIQMNPFQII